MLYMQQVLIRILPVVEGQTVSSTIMWACDSPIQVPDQAGHTLAQTVCWCQVLPVASPMMRLSNLINAISEPSLQAFIAGTDDGTPLRLPFLAFQISLIEHNPSYQCLQMPAYAANSPSFFTYALLQQQQQDDCAVAPAYGAPKHLKISQHVLRHSETSQPAARHAAPRLPATRFYATFMQFVIGEFT